MSEEFVLDTAVVRGFVADVQATIAASSSPEDACEALRPRFAELLADPDWLPAAYLEPAPASGMGGGIGQWLLYRAEDESLSLFSLVVPPGSETPIHDHLAWGLVGLYRGEQDEEIYARRDDALELVERRSLVPGDFYALIPPRDDIHRVRTTSAVTSVSIHLLTNDTGCVWRHSFDPASGEASPFRSGYVNVDCEDDRSAGKRLSRVVDAGKRGFGRLRSLVHRLPAGRHLWRVGIAVVGLVVVLAGVAMLVLPGPGWAVIFVGVGIWATEFPWAHRLLKFVRREVAGMIRWTRRRPRWVWVAVGAGCVLLVVTAAWVVFA